MKQFLPLAGLAAALALAASQRPVDPALLQVKTVYILPMGSGLDQYLASHLTQRGVFEVVTDPQRADAIFTDRLGESFERRMEQLYPPPKPPAPPPSAADKDKKDSKDSAADKDEASRISEENNALRTPTFGRNRGTLFLVSRQTRNVIWSLYARPKDTSSASLDRTADRIAHRLQMDRNPQDTKAGNP